MIFAEVQSDSRAAVCSLFFGHVSRFLKKSRKSGEVISLFLQFNTGKDFCDFVLRTVNFERFKNRH